MKTFLAVLIASSACILPCSAQRNIGAVSAPRYTNTASAVSGFGNVGHPGSVAVPQSRPGAFRTGAVRSSRFISTYPVFIGGYGYGGYDSGYGSGYGQNYAVPQQPPVNVTVVNAPPQAPTVIINQNFAPRSDSDSDTTRIYQPAPPAYSDSANGNSGDAAPAVHYFLVAFKDHSVYSALAYWIEDKTLHYVTAQQTHNQASLDLVDLDLTNKLNQH